MYTHLHVRALVALNAYKENVCLKGLQAALISCRTPRWLGRLPCNSEIMGSNLTQGRTQGFDLNNTARASVNAESLCIPISQIQ